MAQTHIADRPRLTIADAAGRLFGALLLAAPGAGLAALYARRVLAFRAEPAISPGTPAETWIALMVMGVAYASLAMSLAALRGRVNRPTGAVGFMCLTVVVLVIGGAVVGVR